MIKIYDINDNVLMQAEVTSAAKREQEMSKSDYISLSFSAAEKVILPVGAYINYTYKIDKVREVTRKFLLLEAYEPTQSDEISWKYEPQFQHPKMILSKTPFFIYTHNSKNEKIKQNVWSFVGTTSVLSEKIEDFLNNDLKFGNCGWKVVMQSVTANTVNVSFSDNDFISALTAIANAIGDNCEWHIDYDDEFIYIGKVIIGSTPYALEVGKNVGVPSVSNSKEDYYNAFSIFGGTRNITQVNSKGENISSGDVRLQLSEGKGTISIDGKEHSYTIDKFSTLDLRENKDTEPIFTKVLDFTDIFPSLNTYVYNVRGREKYVLTDGKKIPLTYNTDGSVKEYKTFTVWYMRLAYQSAEKIVGKEIINTTVDDGVTHYWYDFEITDDLLVNGKNIGCSFEANFNTDALSTPLAGRGSNGDYVGFGLTYHKEAESSHTGDDVSSESFSVLEGDYEIIYQEDNDVIVPTNASEMLVPHGEDKPSLKCNITVLYNIAMADSIYYSDAQQRLLDKAEKEIVRLLSDLNNYTVKSYPQVFLQENPKLQIGQSVTYKDGHGYELDTRVLKLSTNIDYDIVQEITVGNQAIKGTITQLKEDVQTIIASGGGNGNGNSYTVAQLRSMIARYGSDNFLSKQFDDTAQGLITFAKGLVANGLAQLKQGATFGNNGYHFDKDGNVVVDALSSLSFDEALQKGFGITKDAQGKYTMSVTNLMVWGKAIFNSLEIRKLYAVGGNVYLSGASSKLQHVERMYDSDGNLTGYKCYILADDGTTATQNGWRKYDQAKCQTFDIKEGTYENISNTYYWRLVTDVSTENDVITKQEEYTDEDGKVQLREVVLYDGKKFAWIMLSATDCDTNSDAPSEGDTIVLDGHRMFAEGDELGRDEYNDEDRTNVMMLETTGTGTPRIVALTGITSYSHGGDTEETKYSNTVFILSPKEVVFISSKFKWISESGQQIRFVNYRGNWVEGTDYYYYDQVTHNNALWTCMAQGSDNPTALEPSDENSSVWLKSMEVSKGEKGEKGDKGDPGEPGKDGQNAIRLDLTNENSSVTCDKDGNPLVLAQSTSATLYDGVNEANVDDVVYSIASYEGLAEMPTINEGGVVSNINVKGGITIKTATIQIKAVYKNVSYYANYTISKVFAGDDGSPAVSRWLEPSATVIKVDKYNAVSPSTISCNQYKQVGDDAPVGGDMTIYYRNSQMGNTYVSVSSVELSSVNNITFVEFVLADKTPSESDAIIYDRETIPVVTDGKNGKDGVDGIDGTDAVSWQVSLVRGSNGITQGLYVNVSRSIGDSILSGTIISFGLKCKAYVDGSLADGLTSRLTSTDNYIDFSAFPDGKDFSVAIYDGSTLLASGNYAMGEDGDSALEILVTPETLVFDTNDSGLVPSGTSKSASISCYRNGEKATNVSYAISSNTNCSATVSASSGTATVQISGITTQTVDGVTVSNTSGYATVQVWDKDTSLYHYVQVKFAVNVAKFTGSMSATNKKFQTVYNELSNPGTNDSLTNFYSKIEQTSRSISLKVGENAVGRNNMLVGSAFRKQDDGYVNNGTDGYQYIHTNYRDVLGGQNAIAVLGQSGDKQTFDGVSFRNIPVNGEGTYSISCMAMRSSTSFGTGGCIMIVHQMAKPDSEIIIQPSFTLLDASDERGKWVEKKFTLKMNKSARYVNVIFCVVTSGEFYVAKPMMVQGDGTNMMWSMSKQDYDYIGGNILEGTKLMQATDNKLTVYGTRTLVDSANGIYAIEGKAASSATYGGICKFLNVSVKAGKDYILSMYVKRTRGGALGQLLVSMGSNVKYYERWDNGYASSSQWGGSSTCSGYIGVANIPTEWTRIWIHYQFIADNDAQSIQINFYGDTSTDGIDGLVKQVKFEEGATMTDWTESGEDMVSKQALLDTGIDIEKKTVTVTADNFIVRNNSGTQTAMVDGNGKLATTLVDADTIVAKGIKTQVLEAQNLNVTGNSNFGIWKIAKDSTWGDIIQAEGEMTLPNGNKVTGSGIMYTPLFVRGGYNDVAPYFRVGTNCTEFSYPVNDGNFNGIWFGQAAAYVCKGLQSAINTPFGYIYNSNYNPAAYIYAKKSGLDDPALAINVVAYGTGGSRTAIQTNGAIRGVSAPNVMNASFSQTIQTGVGTVMCTNSSEMTLTLPPNPVEGQVLVVIQGNAKVLFDPNGKKIYCGGIARDASTKFSSGTVGQFNIFIYANEAWQCQFINNRA